MDVIPVIDVQHGIAVQAVRGERAAYRPLSSPLAASADPVAVAKGLQSLFSFQNLYVADLDGIEGRGMNKHLPHQLTAALPDVRIWIDDGTVPQAVLKRTQSESRTMVVIGSESITCRQDVDALRALDSSCYALSLDYKGDRFVGPPDLLDDPSLWPARVIVMTLARVGSNEGPDLERVGDVIARGAGTRRVYAAGGVRNKGDITALRGIGATGVLVASALHAGKISADDLRKITGR